MACCFVYWGKITDRFRIYFESYGAVIHLPVYIIVCFWRNEMGKAVTMVINLILDESGSMSYKQTETLQAVNQYIIDQKEQSRKDILFSLTKFNRHATIVHNMMFKN